MERTGRLTRGPSAKSKVFRHRIHPFRHPTRYRGGSRHHWSFSPLRTGINKRKYVLTPRSYLLIAPVRPSEIKFAYPTYR